MPNGAAFDSIRAAPPTIYSEECLRLLHHNEAVAARYTTMMFALVDYDEGGGIKCQRMSATTAEIHKYDINVVALPDSPLCTCFAPHLNSGQIFDSLCGCGSGF